RLDRAQGLAERVGVVGFDGGGARAVKTEAGEDRFRQRQSAAQAGDVMARLGAQQQAYRRGAVGVGGGDRLDADLRNLVDLERDNVGRQPVAVTRQRVDHAAAVLAVVQ